MAIYHLHMQTISRSVGRSAVAAAAYRSASRLCDPHGTVFDYQRKTGVAHSNIIVPNGYPAINRQVLWCMAEAAEKRKNSTVAREMDVALPLECSREEQLEIVIQFCSWLAQKWQVAVDFNLHYPTNAAHAENPHAQPPAHPAPSQGHTADPVPIQPESQTPQTAAQTPASQPEQPKKMRPRPTLDERLAKIAKRKAALEKAEARLTAEARKERTGQLIAWGLWVEHYCKVASQEERQSVERMVCAYLKDRNLERAKAGFERVRGERKK